LTGVFFFALSLFSCLEKGIYAGATMVIVDAPPPPIHFHEIERDGCMGGMFNYCGCGHLVRIFVIGTIAPREVNVRSQFAAGIMFRSAAYLVFIFLES
jgi:hypothetical protein